MVIIEDLELRKGMEEAYAKIKKDSGPVLVSQVQQIEEIDPLSFFAAGKAQFSGERFYWKDNDSKKFFAGLGTCKEISAEGETNRFFYVENNWQRFIKNNIILNSFQEQGIGPMIFGGFSFDPYKEKTSLWSKFSDGLFRVPKFLLTKANGKTYLSTNILFTRNDRPELADNVIQERNKLIKAASRCNVELEDIQIAEKTEINPLKWKETVNELIKDLQKDKTLKKAVLARELRVKFNKEVSVETVIHHLLKQQKESYVFAFEVNGDCFLGASPERLAKKEGNKVFSSCVAGSIGRGKTEEEDVKLGQTLLSDEKNLIEHQYVVDMIQEAMEKVCKKIHLPEKPTLLKTRDIQHLYTPVTGEMEEGNSFFGLVERLHPTPALGGLPKMEAVKKIRETEELDRGFYGAPLGWMDFAGNGEFIVAIRSGLIQGKEASLFAGCGVVKDSDTESEYIETKIKFRPMLSALGGRVE